MSQLTEPWTVLNDTLMRPGPSERGLLFRFNLPQCPEVQGNISRDTEAIREPLGMTVQGNFTAGMDLAAATGSVYEKCAQVFKGNVRTAKVDRVAIALENTG
mgnify:CR=1 FL=1